MQIGIVNAGNIGLRLAMAWIRKGHDIMLSKDTHAEQLRERVRALSLEYDVPENELIRFKYGTMAEAVEFGTVVVMSIYFPRMPQVLKEIKSNGVTLSGKTILDTSNPLNVDAEFNHYHDLDYMKRTSITEEIQEEFPEATVFKAFNTMPAMLLHASKWHLSRVPPVFFVGGSPSSIGTARQLIEDAGFKSQFAGYNLKNSGLLESLGLLMHLVAENEYQGDSGVVFDVIKQKP